MSFFNLHFSDKQLENLFRTSLNPSKFEKYLEIIFLWIFILISFPQRTEIIIGLGLLGLTALFLHFLKITHKSFGFSLIIALSIIILYSLTKSPIHVNFDENLEDFMQGWSFACIEVILASQAPKIEGKIMTLILSVILRFGILGGFDVKFLTAEILLKHILYEIFLVFIFYRFEKVQRNLFKDNHEAQQEISQLKTVLQKLSSPSLLVLNHQTQKSLFQNHAFDLLLQGFENNNSNFLTAVQINHDVSLKTFLQKLQIHSFSGSETWLLSGSCKIQEKLFFFDITISSITWDKVPSILIALENITPKKELSDIQLAQEDKDLLIATVSHELRNPLHGILGLIQMMEPNIIKENETFEYLSLCKDNTNLLLNLVNSLLDNQQIQHGDIKLNPSQVQIEPLVKSVLSLFSFQASQKNIKLLASMKDNIPSHIITDENRLKQVLINLVSNALKFTVSGSITIKIHHQDQNHLRFSVSDTGRGIQRDDLNKIFRIYTKLEDKEGFNKHGVGLGLTISNSIAKLLAHQQQDGIIVESQYGSGSTFSFLVHQNLNKALSITQQATVENIQDFEEFSKPTDLQSKLSFYTSTPHSSSPKDSNLSKLYTKKGISIDPEILQRSHSTPLYISKMTKSEPRLHNSKGLILVVDDNYFNLLIAKNLLENLGYQVQTALSGTEAIENFEDSVTKGLCYLCILMDCQMPLMDGFETTKILKKIMVKEKIKSVPIVALTASQDKNTIENCYENGMVGHLSKPLVKEDILRVLAKFEIQE